MTAGWMKNRQTDQYNPKNCLLGGSYRNHIDTTNDQNFLETKGINLKISGRRTSLNIEYISTKFGIK